MSVSARNNQTTACCQAVSQGASVLRRGDTVCQVLHGLAVGGAEMLAADLARRLQKKYRFVFACLDELGSLGEQLREEGFAVEVLGRQEGVDLCCAWNLSRVFDRHKVQLVHAHQYTPFFYSLAAGMCGRRRPVIFTEHGRWYPDFPRQKRILFNRLALRKKDRVVAVGQNVQQALAANEGIPQDRIRVIYNGVDVQRYAGATDLATTRSELGVMADDFVILQVARLDHLKDHLTALRTMERVREHVPYARLLLVGDGPERAAIEEMIRRFQLESHVRLLGTRADIDRLLGVCDLFLLTSISEGVPLTVLEAMAAGRAVVATRVGGVPEVVDDGVTGLLAPAGDDEALAAAVLRLTNDAALRQQMGAAGRLRAERLFSQEQNHAAYEQLYSELMYA